MYKQTSGYYNTKKQGKYDSNFEAGYADELELRVKANDIKAFDSHQRMELNVGNFHICNYYIDFVVYHNDDTVEYVETKGYPTTVWRLKWKLFEALYSEKEGVTLTVVYQNSNRYKVPKARKIKK